MVIESGASSIELQGKWPMLDVKVGEGTLNTECTHATVEA